LTSNRCWDDREVSGQTDGKKEKELMYFKLGETR